MAKLSCFPALLPLAGKKKKKTRKIADANKDELPKVELIDATLLAPGVDVKLVPAAHPAVPVEEEVEDRSNNSIKELAHRLASEKQGSDPLSDFDLHFQESANKSIRFRSDSDVARDTAAGAAAAEDPPSPKLKRSCSNIETKRPAAGSRAAPQTPARRSRSYGDLGNLIAGLALDTTSAATPHGGGAPGPEASPASSVRTADRVMLKKRSSSQVLPSRSRKLWWRLFLWSHRNLHKMPPRSSSPRTAGAHQESSPGRHGGGYTSDTFEEEADDGKNKNKKVLAMADDSLPPSSSSSVPNFNHNQWVAFSADNSIHDRVSAWMSSSIETLESEPPFRIAEEEEEDNCYDGEDDDEAEQGQGGDEYERASRHLELGEPSSSSGKQGGKSGKRCAAADEAVVQANAIVQSLNAFSSVAHIAGMGLKVVPMIAPFSTLRAVNLSSNFIVHISPGSLPKGLHSLDLSRNKIANVEGLRELTKLRVLNLSYNRISRIGHGLSNCTAIRELYLAGNKLSDVEGLHRLLKLAVLDLSFNRVTTAKALGQLVANYHSLLALNLVGNPVQANVGDDALRRAVTGLLPSLAYLNKQPLKPQRGEVATDTIARAALGGGGGGSSGSRKRTTARRLTQMSPRSSAAALLARGRGGGGAGGGGSPTPRNPSRRR